MSGESGTAYAETLKNRGNAALGEGDVAGAESWYRQAISVDPAYMPAHNNLGNVLLLRGQYEASLSAYRVAARLAPDDYQIHDNIGITLNAMARFVEALSAFDHAVGLAPEAPSPRLNRSVAHLHLGRWEEGFLDYESRLAMPVCAVPEGLLASGKPWWGGGRLDGKTLLIYHEQGMGDMIQFLRYVPLCGALGARVMVCCDPSLTRLLSRAEGIDVVTPDNVPLPEPFDAYISVMSLAHVLGRCTDLPPLRLNVPVDAMPAISQAGGLKVGVCWRGSPMQGRDNVRSIPREIFWNHLGEIPAVTFFNLQIGSGDASEFATSLGPYIGDFHDTANLVQQLDLVVTVCTSVAHLCGTLGVPTALLLSYSPDWRWGVAGERTPWYPSIHMFRQPSLGDWGAPLLEIRKYIESRKPRRE